MDARVPHAVDQPDAADELAFERARPVDVLLELGRGQPVGLVEDLVADRSAGRQTGFGEEETCRRDVRRLDEDRVVGGVHAVRDVRLVEQVRHRRGLVHVEVAVEQRHAIIAAAARAAAQHQQSEHAEHAKGDQSHRRELRRAERAEPVEDRVDARSPGRSFRCRRVHRSARPIAGILPPLEHGTGTLTERLTARQDLPGAPAGKTASGQFDALNDVRSLSSSVVAPNDTPMELPLFVTAVGVATDVKGTAVTVPDASDVSIDTL